MVSFENCWYPIDDDYEERTEDGVVLGLIQGHWYPVADAVLDMFPFFDLSDEELHELHEIWYEDPLDYEDPDADEPYDMLLIE